MVQNGQNYSQFILYNYCSKVFTKNTPGVSVPSVGHTPTSSMASYGDTLNTSVTG